MSSTIEDVRQHLLGTLADLRNKESPMEPDRARAIAQVASVIVDSARVEVDYIKSVSGSESKFLESTTISSEPNPQLPPGVANVRTHRIKG